jgi:hypothetical protein
MDKKHLRKQWQQILYFITSCNILNLVTVKVTMKTQDVMKDMLLWMKRNNDYESEVKFTALVIQYNKMYKANDEY